MQPNQRNFFVLLAMLILRQAVNGQDLTIEVDQESGKITKVLDASGLVNDRRNTATGEKEIKVYASGKVTIKIVNTNTAFYKYKLTKEDAEADEPKQLKAFMTGLGPYLVDLGNFAFAEITRTRGAAKSHQLTDDLTDNTIELFGLSAQQAVEDSINADLNTIKKEVKKFQQLSDKVFDDVNRVNALLFYDDKSVRKVFLKSQKAFQDMYSNATLAPNITITARADTLYNVLNEHFEPNPTSAGVLPKRYKTIKEIIDAYEQLNNSTAALEDVKKNREALKGELSELKAEINLLNDDAVKKGLLTLCEALLTTLGVIDNQVKVAETALTNHDKTLQAARDVEEFAIALMTAEDTKEFTIDQNSFLKGKVATLEVTPGGTLATAGKEGEASKYTITVLPNWRYFRPSVGLSLMGWVGPRINKFVAVGNPDSTFTIQSRSAMEPGFTYGLTIGFTHQGLDWRDATGKGYAIWLPELTVNPFDKFRAIAVGAAISRNIFKLGVGWMLIKQEVLDGQAEGQILNSASQLKVREIYPAPANGRFYISFSISGWPPFVN